jgi:hypothetical protein
MELSRRRPILVCNEGLPFVKVFILHTEEYLKPTRWHRVHMGYKKVIPR